MTRLIHRRRIRLTPAQTRELGDCLRAEQQALAAMRRRYHGQDFSRDEAVLLGVPMPGLARERRGR